MKRSKIFLGITTGILAVVGIAAAKTARTSVARFYCTVGSAGNKTCASTGTLPHVSDPTGTYSVPFSYTNGTPVHSVVTGVIYTTGPVGSLCSTTNCIHPLLYKLNN